MTSSPAKSLLTSPRQNKKTRYFAIPGCVLDWEAFTTSPVPWRPEIQSLLEQSRLRALCCGPCDWYEDVVKAFYENANVQFATGDSESASSRPEEPATEEEGRIVSQIGDVDVIITADVFREVFDLPTAETFPPSNVHLMAKELGYDDGGVINTRHVYRKMGFKGRTRFVANLFGKTIFCQRTGTDSVPLAHMQCIYCLLNNYCIDWGGLIFNDWVDHIDYKGYGRLLIKILLRRFPGVFRARTASPYPAGFILRGIHEDGRLYAKPFSSKPKQTGKRRSEKWTDAPDKKTKGVPDPPIAQSKVDPTNGQQDSMSYLLEDLWMKYAQKFSDADQVRQLWIRQGKTMIVVKDLIQWGLSTRQVTERQGEQLLGQLQHIQQGESPHNSEARMSKIEADLKEIMRHISESAKHKMKIDRIYELMEGMDSREEPFVTAHRPREPSSQSSPSPAHDSPISPLKSTPVQTLEASILEGLIPSTDPMRTPKAVEAYNNFVKSEKQEPRFTGSPMHLLPEGLKEITSSAWLSTITIDHFGHTLCQLEFGPLQFTVLPCVSLCFPFDRAGIERQVRGEVRDYPAWSTLDVVLIPILIDKHFVLIYVNLQGQVMELFDSYHVGNFEVRIKVLRGGYLACLNDVLISEKLIKHHLELRWLPASEIPQQPDGDSCGAFVCYYMLSVLQLKVKWDFGPTTPAFAHSLREMIAQFIYYHSEPV